MVLAGIFADSQNSMLFQQRERADVQDQLSLVRAKLEGNINGNIQLVRGLVATISTEPGIDQDRYTELAEKLFANNSQLRNIAGAPGLVVSLMYPIAGNERAIGLDYRNNEAQRDAAIRARDSKQVVLAGPVDLVQGGRGFIARFPVFVGEPGPSTFWGIISAVIDLDRLYADSGLLDPAVPISIAIVGHDGLGTEGRQFFGPQDILQRQPLSSHVQLPTGSWEMFAVPKDGWSDTPPTAPALRLVMVLLGALVVIPAFIIGRLTEQRKRTVRALAASEVELKRVSRRLGMALQTSKVGVWEYDIDADELHWDNRVNAIFGLPQDGGKRDYTHWRNALHPDDVAQADAAFQRAVETRGTYESDYRIITPDGLRYVRAIATVYKDQGQNTKVIGVNWDVTADFALSESLKEANKLLEAQNAALAKAKAEIEHNALHDSLTGLPNRRYLDDMLQVRAARCAQHGSTLALLHIDLDRFKQINDTLGHAAGDAMLVHASRVLKSNTRPSDFVARIGGDEFVVLCILAGGDDHPTDLANRIIGRMRQPVNYQGHECRFGVSIGIATAEGAQIDPKKLLVDADIALYKAKSRGRNRFEFFSESLQAEVVETKRVADQILQGLDRGEFEPWFQLQFDARTLDVVGCEALARWRHPTEGILTPDRFLSVAEELNVVPSIDRLVLEQSLSHLARWQSEGLDVPRISVNVSARRLQDEHLVQSLRDLQIKPGTVSFELVESIFLDESDDVVLWHIDQIKELGIDIEIDDFGTGYASIVSLLKLKPRRLKLDRQLVTPIVGSQSQRHLVESVIEIGKSLDIDVVGEGVETMDHARVLRDLGCDILQGFAFARPMPASDMAGFLRAESWRERAGPLRKNRGIVVKRRA
ncbi:MAG TPA: EAL domain-containing protein [Devosia sp.]